jgi:hypothetical protein
MALSATALLGRVDMPPSFVGQSAQAPKLSAFVVEFTIQAADYSSGITFAAIVAAVNAVAQPAVQITAIMGAVVLEVRVAANTLVGGFGEMDVNAAKLRFLTAATPTDYTATNNDVWRVLVIGL